MWKKDGMPDQPAAQRPEAAPAYERVAPPRSTAERATIGRSITIRGEVTGDEDLLIQGRVEGSVNLKQHSVTVGPEGEVTADITGKVITIEGRVQGNLSAEEQVILRGSATVEGDIAAPRVVLDDGARFRGGVDMGETAERTGRNATATPNAATRAPDTAATPSAAEASNRPGAAASAGKQDSASQTTASVTR
jgi:cytoskeletal protein CcmA (bactofilin family)